MINQCKGDSYESFNETTFDKNVLKRSSNNLAKKQLSMDGVTKDNFYKKILLDIFQKNNENINYNNNQINNYLNINVNINLGCHKHNYSSSTSENDSESKDDKVKIDLGGNNPISKSPDKTQEDIKEKNSN